jgi:hypothetical protein
MAPFGNDISHLSSILNSFGEVTGLVSNLQKSLVATIRCDDIDLESVLHDLPAKRTTFPMRYLGLPLGVKKLKRIHFQYLEDKAANRLVPWNGKHFTMAGRRALVKSVLTSQVIYPLTAIDVPAEPLQAIQKIIRGFLWAGNEKATGRKCKVNWTAVCRPTSLGGLRILNMEKFGRALRLRWPWFEWTASERPWVGLGNPCTKDDMDFFYAMTNVTISDGKKAIFWDAPWAGGGLVQILLRLPSLTSPEEKTRLFAKH